MGSRLRALQPDPGQPCAQTNTSSAVLLLRAVNTPVVRTETEFSKHTNFSQKKNAVTTRLICSISDAAFKFSKIHPKHISIKHMVCRKCYITIEFSSHSFFT